MSVLDTKQYHDNGYKAFGFLSAEEYGVRYMRSYAILGRGKDQLKEAYEESVGEKKHIITYTLLVLLGYIPIIGIFTGLFKIWLGTYIDRHPKKGVTNISKITHAFILRGVAEICGLGILMLPVDIYITYQRRKNPITAEEVIATGA
jgi:hypothetical protein